MRACEADATLDRDQIAGMRHMGAPDPEARDEEGSQQHHDEAENTNLDLHGRSGHPPILKRSEGGSHRSASFRGGRGDE